LLVILLKFQGSKVNHPLKKTFLACANHILISATFNLSTFSAKKILLFIKSGKKVQNKKYIFVVAF
jgi:hypothetical protein